MDKKYRVLVLCTGNSARSQMAADVTHSPPGWDLICDCPTIFPSRHKLATWSISAPFGSGSRTKSSPCWKTMNADNTEVEILNAVAARQQHDPLPSRERKI